MQKQYEEKKEEPRVEKPKYSLNKTILLISLVIFLILSLTIIFKSRYTSHRTQNKPMQPVFTIQIPTGHLALPFNTENTLLMSIPTNCEANTYRFFTSFSPNGRNVGFICGAVIKENKSWYTTNQPIINGKRQKIYNSVNAVNFDTKYDEYAYSAKGNGKDANGGDYMIFNGSEIGKYPAESISPLGEAGNDNRLFYTGHLAYVSNSNNTNKFVYDGKVVAETGKKYSFVFNPLLSNDGNHFIFSAEKGSEMHSVIVRDGKEIDQQNGFIRNLVINNDASKFAYSLESSNSARIVSNGIVGKTYSDVSNIKMSQNGKHIAFLAQNQTGSFWVVDGKEYTQYKEVGENFFFSPDSSHFVFSIIDPSNSHHQSLIEDGQQQGSYKIISNLVYSKNGKTLAFFASVNNISYIVVNNVNTPLIIANPSQTAHDLTVSPDGKTVMYKVSDGIHENAVINGKLSESYDMMLTQFYFSPDGKYVGFGIQKDNQLWWIAMNLITQTTPNKLHITGANTPIPTHPIISSSPTVSISSYKTFTSDILGISFSYPPTSWDITPRVIGTKIFFGSDTGQFIQVIHLSHPENSIESAIKNTVLNGYSDEDCQVVTEKPGNRGFGLNMESATITFPGNDYGDEYQPTEAFCPKGYINKGGIFYFIMDKKHPSTLIFISESQQPLAGIGSPLTNTIKVIH
jgi:hypothetical protein